MKNIFKITRASCTSDSIKPGSSLNDTKVEEFFVVSTNFDSVIDWIKKTHSGEFILGPEINIQNEKAYQKDWLWFSGMSTCTWHGKPGSGVYSSCWDMTVSVNDRGKLITLERRLYGKGWKGFAYKYHIVYRNIPVVEIF